ncbi:MAG: hypothetical protein EOO77_39895 [Oxalobacteraceae bacterium]|nr:MAG: hypothetical protein EOO77_39895 [Oxalobacteraceae bacterium]
MAGKLKAPEGENRKRRRANETLRKASTYFAQAKLAPLRLPSNDAVHRRNLVGRLRLLWR